MRNRFRHIVIAAAAVLLAAGARPVAAASVLMPPQHIWYYQNGVLVGEGFVDCDGQFYMLWGVKATVRTIELTYDCPGQIEP